MISYTWKVNQLERATTDDYVTTVHYGVDAVDGDHTAGSYGTASFDSATSPSSTAYASLDEATVVGWVQAKVDKAQIETALAADIALQQAPVSASGTPWASEAP